MGVFQLALLILGNIAAARTGVQSQAITDAIAKMTDVYNALREAAAQDAELTPEHDAALDAQAAIVFASPAADPSANT